MGYTSSPLQQNIDVNTNATTTGSIDYQNPVMQQMAQAADMNLKAYDSGAFHANNFNFTNGQNGWNGLGNFTGGPQPQPLPRTNTSTQSQPVVPSIPEFGAVGNGGAGGVENGDMGFDWMSWMSTANVSMGPVEEFGTG
jgi:hypothetical protein